LVAYKNSEGENSQNT
jgi:hypothetical protein